LLPAGNAQRFLKGVLRLFDPVETNERDASEPMKLRLPAALPRSFLVLQPFPYRSKSLLLTSLRGCVTDTTDAPCASKISTSRVKFGERRGQPVDLRRQCLRPALVSASRLASPAAPGCRPRTRHHNGFWPMPSARRVGRRRAAGPAHIAPTCGNISVGGYFSTAFSAMRSRQVVSCALGLEADAGLDEVVQASLRTTSRCKTARLTDG
jgi:hypothetical protein